MKENQKQQGYERVVAAALGEPAPSTYSSQWRYPTPDLLQLGASAPQMTKHNKILFKSSVAKFENC